jgi:acetate kinase
MILAINGGSASLKFAAFDGEACVLRGVAYDLDEVIERVPQFAAVGHRIVHGGVKHDKPTLVDDALLTDLDAAIEYAPNQMPLELAAIYKLRARYRQVPQVACFDTGFHATLPQAARTQLDGTRRRGRHGLSFEYISSMLTPAQQERAVFAHLGITASLVAVRDGQAVDVAPIIDRDGWIAIARTFDMHQLLGSRATDPRSALAIELFCHAVKKAIGGFAAVLGGIDTLVFTGGIGEHAAAISQQICEGLGFLEIKDVLTIPTDEELVIARATRRVVTRM